MLDKLQVVFDCADPERVARFWAAALDYTLDWSWANEEDVAFVRSGGLPESEVGSRSAASDPAGVRPRLFFQRVPEDKAGKNRVHVDVKAPEGGLEAEVERLVGLGATVDHRHEGDFGPFHEVHYVMQDPEGNEFCVS
ncbi:MAG TPA: VOC family protein [Acidimicrobiales bacterium]|jgi:catechol 2,3-dioxygenase-like lactoylglutathione lyase family enzyme|nr:VOC family protein [Acidimicrobiales bacterium]